MLIVPRLRLGLTIRYLIVKAVLISVAALALGRLSNFEHPTMVIFAALLCITPAFYRGVRKGLRNIYATLFGAAVAILLVYTVPIPYIAVPAGVAILFVAAAGLWWLEQFPLALITFLYLVLPDRADLWEAGLDRFLSISLGVLIAMVISYLMTFFRYRELYLSQLRGLLAEVASVMGDVTASVVDGDAQGLAGIDSRFHPLFRRLGMFEDEIVDLKKEFRVRRRSGGLSYKAVSWMARIIDAMQGVTHHLRDIVSLGVDLMGEGALDGEVKGVVDGELRFLTERIVEIVTVAGGEELAEPMFSKLRGPGEICHPVAEPDLDEDEIRIVSLQMSLRHLRSELWELAKYIQIFQGEVLTTVKRSKV